MTAIAYLAAEALLLVIPPGPDGAAPWLRSLEFARAVPAMVTSPADPCGDAVAVELPARGGPLSFPLSGSLAVQVEGVAPEELLEGLTLRFSADPEGPIGEAVAPELVLRAGGPLDLQAWILYPHFTWFTPDGVGRALRLTTDHAIGGPAEFGDPPDTAMGAWRLRGRRLWLRGPDGRELSTRVHHEDSGRTEVHGAPLDPDFPQFWFRWGDAIVVSQTLTAC